MGDSRAKMGGNYYQIDPAVLWKWWGFDIRILTQRRFSTAKDREKSNVLTLSPGDGGDSRGNERGSDQSFTTAVWGKYPGFALYRQKGL